MTVKDASLEKVGKRNRYAKIRVESEEATVGELIQLFGPVGEYEPELEAYQLHYGVKPCRYPEKATWDLTPVLDGHSVHEDCTALNVFSIDNASTRDIDDALSFEFDGPKARIGIHVADVASRVPVSSPLFQWALQRGGSAYHSGLVMQEDAKTEGEAPKSYEGGSVPMLPTELAHDELSLNQGVPRNALSLFLEVRDGKVTSMSHQRTRIVNANATT